MASPTTDRRLGLAGNKGYKAPVTVLADSNITLSGEQTIDGVAVLASNSAGVPDRVLCVGQTTASENGIWDVSTGSWTRSVDANGNYDLGHGTTVLVNQGSTYAGSYWKLDTSGSITIGSTSLSWSRALASSLSTVDFLQAGTGAVVRGGQDKMRDIVSVFDFMTAAQIADVAARTYSLDLTSAINACITKANSDGKDVGVPPGGYSALSIALKSNVTLRLHRGAVIRKRGGAAGTHVIDGVGSLGTATALTADAALGDTSVAVTSASGFSADGWALLRDATYISGSAGRNQEIVRVSSVAGLTINLRSPLIGSYATASSAELVPLTPCENACVIGGKIEVPTGTAGGGIFFDLSVGCKVIDTEGTGASDEANVQFERSFDFLVQNTNCHDNQSLTSGGYGYGVAVGESSHHGLVVGARSERVRENLVTNRARFVDIALTSTRYSESSGWNTHGSGCQYIRFISPKADSDKSGGIVVGFGSHTAGDKDVSIINPEIVNARDHGISINAPVGLENERVYVWNPKIRNVGLGGTSADYGITVGNCIGGGIFNAVIDGGNNNSVSAGVLVTTATDFSVSGGTIENMSNGYGVQMNGVTRCHTKGVAFKSISSNNVYYLGTNSGCRVSGNEADDSTRSIDAATIDEGNSWNDEVREQISFFDDFLGDVLADQWNGRVGSDAQCVTPTLTASRNGRVRLIAGDDAGGTMALNGCQLDMGILNWRAGNGGLVMEFSVIVTTITDVAVFVGFTDQVAALEMPFTLAAGDALTSNATDAVGILFDTAADTDNWWLVGVKADVDATKQNAAVAPSAGVAESWKIVVDASGNADFFRNGSRIGTQMANALTNTVTLTPVVAAFSRGAATRNVEVDYIGLKMTRV